MSKSSISTKNRELIKQDKDIKQKQHLSTREDIDYWFKDQMRSVASTSKDHVGQRVDAKLKPLVHLLEIMVFLLEMTGNMMIWSFRYLRQMFPLVAVAVSMILAGLWFYDVHEHHSVVNFFSKKSFLSSGSDSIGHFVAGVPDEKKVGSWDKFASVPQITKARAVDVSDNSDDEKPLMPQLQQAEDKNEIPITNNTKIIKVGKVMSRVLNVRKGPGLEFLVSRKLYRNSKIYYVSVKGAPGWVEIYSKNQPMGEYVSQAYLRVETIKQETKIKLKTYLVTIPVLNVRSGPSTDFGIKSKKYKNQKVRGLLLKNGWLQTEFGDFIYARYLVIKGTARRNPSVKRSFKYQVKSYKSYIRKGPGKGFAIINKIKKGSVITGKKVSSQWLQIGLSRYVSLEGLRPFTGSSVQPDSDGIQPSQVDKINKSSMVDMSFPKRKSSMLPMAYPSIAKSFLRVAMIDGLRVREGPSVFKKVVRTLNKGSEVRVIAKKGNWYKIGPQEYVYSAFLSMP